MCGLFSFGPGVGESLPHVYELFQGAPLVVGVVGVVCISPAGRRLKRLGRYGGKRQHEPGGE